jgi:hypothetical protein
MNKTATQSLTTGELLTETQASTNRSFFSDLELLDTSTVPTFNELLEEYKAAVDKPEVAWSLRSLDELTTPFAIYQRNLAHAKPQPVRWLWQKRLPLAGITLLDGDHGCGKSLLALQIAACVSSGTPLPDGTPTIQGNVVIVSPNIDASTTQLQLLTAMGADLSRVEILSYIQESEPSSHTGGYRPFSLPEDFTCLFQAVKRVDARLVIFDPFINLLSRGRRCTNERLSHLLADLNQCLIEHNVACLLVRNCPAKGGHTRPSMLERSDHFLTIAVSRLLLAPDPFQPDHILLSHALSRHSVLTPTITLQILSKPENPDIPHITVLGSHSLQAKDLLAHCPDTLHRRLLSHHLLSLITAATDPIPVATLYARFPNSSPFQIQRSLNDLLSMGQIERPARGFYTLAPTNPTFPLNETTARTSNISPTSSLKQTAATTSDTAPTSPLKQTTSDTSPIRSFKQTATTTSDTAPTGKLKQTATTTSDTAPAGKLKQTATTTLTPPTSTFTHANPTSGKTARLKAQKRSKSHRRGRK